MKWAMKKFGKLGQPKRRLDTTTAVTGGEYDLLTLLRKFNVDVSL